MLLIQLQKQLHTVVVEFEAKLKEEETKYNEATSAHDPLKSKIVELELDMKALTDEMKEKRDHIQDFRSQLMIQTQLRGELEKERENLSMKVDDQMNMAKMKEKR